MTQPGTSSPGAANGRPPNAAGKAAGNAAAKFLEGAPQASPGAVFRLMQQNFPPSALKWVRKIRWVGPLDLPTGLLDFSGSDKWAARHDTEHVNQIAADMKAGKKVNAIIGVLREGHNHVRLIDGRHRSTAARKTGKPVRAYIGYLDDASEKAAYDTYLKQFHSGDDPRNKSFTAGNLGLPGNVSGLVPLTVEGQRQGPHVAGLAVRAADTGRVLMIQRAITGADPAGGLFEFPGGHAETGESLLAAAAREWAEEVGRDLPEGTLTGRWQSSNGIYEGFVMTIPREDGLDLAGPRTVANPDGDAFEACAFWDPALVNGNPAVRGELRADFPRLMAALDSQAVKSARTPVLEATPRELGPGGLWHTPDRHTGGKQKLPDYIEQVAGALMDQQGMGESEAIATAINAIKRWAAGDLHWGNGKVTPEVIEASKRALAEWNELKESHHAQV
jgi:8-oxo-dGTP pyrophosphatase MutT (NUDIX family)